MKKYIVTSMLVLASIASFNALACSAEHPTPEQKHEHRLEKHKKMHETIIQSMSPAEKANYNKISAMVDGLSTEDKKALALKLRHDFMNLTPEQKKQLHQEHKDLLIKAKQVHQSAPASATKAE